MSHWKDDIVLKVANVLTFIFLFGSNIYSSSAGTISHTRDTYFTPAGYTSYVWVIIHALLIGFLILQFTHEGHEPTVKAIGWRFVLLGILNAIWIHLTAHGHWIVAFVFALLTALVVSHIFYSLKFNSSSTPSSRSLWETLFVHIPFSLWHAYSVFIAVHAIFVAFGRTHAHGAGVGTIVAVVFALLFIVTTAWGYSFADNDSGDITGAIVLAFMTWGVYDAQRHPKSIHISALVAFVLILLAIVKAVAFGYHKRSRGGIHLGDSERGPLVGGN